ncbi:hypothetical protein [Streptococcus infantis]
MAVRYYRIVSSYTPYSATAIPWTEHLLLLRYYLARTSSDTAST